MILKKYEMDEGTELRLFVENGYRVGLFDLDCGEYYTMTMYKPEQLTQAENAFDLAVQLYEKVMK